MADNENREEIEISRFLEEHREQAAVDDEFRRKAFIKTRGIVESRGRRWRRMRKVFTTRRAFVTAGLVAVVVAIGLGILPSRRGNSVLAQVAEAMSNVESVHLIGYSDFPSGEHNRFEVWIKQPAKYRSVIRWGTGVVSETSDDGTKMVVVGTSPDNCTATISASKGAGYVPGLPVTRSGVNLFSREGLLEATTWGIVDSRASRLPDGRQLQVVELAGFNLDDARVVLTIDTLTNLLVQVELYYPHKRGRKTEYSLGTKIENIEYNVDLPDSLFQIEIPQNAEVRDELSIAKRVAVPLSRERQELLAAVLREMDAEHGERIVRGMLTGGSCGSPWHTDMRFEGLSLSETQIWYVKSRNAYYVFGKALVTGSKTGEFKRIVEDGWFVAPYGPKEPLLPGTLVMRIDKPGDYRRLVDDKHDQFRWFFVERIQNVGKGSLILMDEYPRGVRIYGEAEVYPEGKVYHDGQLVRSIEDMRLRSSLDYYDVAKADFGSLPDSEAAALKTEMEKHNRKAEAINRHRRDVQMARKRLPDDAYVCNRFDPGFKVSDSHFESDPEVGMTLIYIPSRDSIYVVGKGRMVGRNSYWRTERIVENEEVKAPGPEYARYYEQRQKERRQVEE